MFQSCRNARPKSVTTAALAALLTVTALGCAPSDVTPAARWGTTAASAPASPSPAASSSQHSAPDPVDYSGLLLQPADLSDDDDTFALRSSTADPKGLPGASALFVNTDDTRAISDTVVLYPDAATAAATLRQAVNTADTVVTGGTAQPSPVGTAGTVIRGTAPDGGKAVTLLMFTQGRALARLEFGSATGDATTDQFVTTIGKMQQIALRIGLSGAE